ncbi:hypothetical protein EJ02DRAFT_451415 [Clathrospora elynae]|uniref:Apple domain-containing protein n=1 Tax=Clathrospora elynae TaxID=706981 RepID=A0A6A5T136_9PLEO|nr:hypothetical protein EJ02DRAFT_451415 [Clathrospora elynae]
MKPSSVLLSLATTSPLVAAVNIWGKFATDTRCEDPDCSIRGYETRVPYSVSEDGKEVDACKNRCILHLRCKTWATGHGTCRLYKLPLELVAGPVGDEEDEATLGLDEFSFSERCCASTSLQRK